MSSPGGRRRRAPEQTTRDRLGRGAVRLLSVPNAVRVVTVAILALAVLAFVQGVPANAPEYALDSGWILRAERAVGVILAGSVVGLLVIHGLLQGRLPSEVSQQGLKWEEAVGNVEISVAQASLATKESVEQIQRTMDAQAQLLMGLAQALADLEGRHGDDPALPSDHDR